MVKSEILVNLLSTFRKYGYEGATLSQISKATGLGKASLYHYFPEGKASMASAVLTHLAQLRETKILAILRTNEPPLTRLLAMTEALQDIYEEGYQPCLLAILSVGDSHAQFASQVKPAFDSLLDAITQVLIEANIDSALARTKAEDAIISIQGALVLGRALESNAPFQRVLKELPERLLKV